MALTESAMLSLATTAPDFVLTDVVTGKPVATKTVAGPKGLLVMFICRHCPFVKHLETALAQLGRDYADKGIGIVAISSNDSGNYPDDAPKASPSRRAISDLPSPISTMKRRRWRAPTTRPALPTSFSSMAA